MNAALRRENVNGVYLALHAKTLKDLLGCVRDIPIHGLSITMPYKEAVLKHLDNTGFSHHEDRGMQHGGARAGRKALRFQH